MVENGRRATRRKSDQLILETIRFNRTILDLLHGKEGDFAEIFLRIQQLSAKLGRRQEDRRLGEDLCEGLRGIVNRLLELGLIEQPPRKVRMKKVMGEVQEKFALGTERIGWEMEPPTVGKRYCVYMDNGNVFRTSSVTQVGVDHFRTLYSVYAIEVLEQSPFEPHKKR